jgi:hypothetical protein
VASLKLTAPQRQRPVLSVICHSSIVLIGSDAALCLSANARISCHVMSCANPLIALEMTPKGINISGYSPARLNAVARKLNERPQKALN